MSWAAKHVRLSGHSSAVSALQSIMRFCCYSRVPLVVVVTMVSGVDYYCGVPSLLNLGIGRLSGILRSEIQPISLAARR